MKLTFHLSDKTIHVTEDELIYTVYEFEDDVCVNIFYFEKSDLLDYLKEGLA